MKTRTMFCLVIISALAFCLAVSQPAIAASAEEEVLQVATNFIKAQNTNDSELMSSLWWHSPKTSYFNPGGIFLTQGWLTGAAGEEGTVVFSLHHPQVTMMGDNAAVITGYLSVMNNDPETNQTTSTVQMKQTLVVQKIDRKWLIVHEHTSFLPK